MKELIPQQIKELVLKLKEHYDKYKDVNYNETQTRREFNNTVGFAESYGDVIQYGQKLKLMKVDLRELQLVA